MRFSIFPRVCYFLIIEFVQWIFQTNFEQIHYIILHGHWNLRSSAVLNWQRFSWTLIAQQNKTKNTTKTKKYSPNPSRMTLQGHSNANIWACNVNTWVWGKSLGFLQVYSEHKHHALDISMAFEISLDTWGFLML